MAVLDLAAIITPLKLNFCRYNCFVDRYLFYISMLTFSISLVYLFILYIFIYLCIYSFIYLCIYSFIYLFIYLYIYLLFRYINFKFFNAFYP